MDRLAEVNEEECVECNTCHRVCKSEGKNPALVRLMRRVLGLFNMEYRPPPDVCPTGALVPPELEWPRSLRRVFSDPTAPHEGTGVHGRGTEEIKTNEVTGRLREGQAGFVVELGRPGIGARFRDIEKMALGLAAHGPHFQPKNPVTLLMADTTTGKLRNEILDEKVMSAIIEFDAPIEKIPVFLACIDEVAKGIDTVCSVGVACKCSPDGAIPTEPCIRQAGYEPSLNGKTNLGLGRPRNN